MQLESIFLAIKFGLSSPKLGPSLKRNLGVL